MNDIVSHRPLPGYAALFVVLKTQGLTFAGTRIAGILVLNALVKGEIYEKYRFDIVADKYVRVNALDAEPDHGGFDTHGLDHG